MRTLRRSFNFCSSCGQCIKNSRMTKVSLQETAVNDNFDRLAQKIMQKLDKEETTPKETF